MLTTPNAIEKIMRPTKITACSTFAICTEKKFEIRLLLYFFHQSSIAQKQRLRYLNKHKSRQNYET